MTTKYGVFKEPSYLGVGDPYKTKVKPDERELGLNFKATVQRTGKTNDATFDKYRPLYEGEKFIDPLRITMQQASEKSKNNITDKAFKCISPTKSSTGKGDFFGTFGGRLEYHTPVLEQKKKKGEIQSQPPGIYTSPAKKGSYGVPKTTISQRAGYQGVQNEYGWAAEPYDLAAKKARAESIERRKHKITEAPFKPSNPGKQGTYGMTGTTLSGKGKGVVGEYEYLALGPGSRSSTGEVDVPFRPTHPNKSGFQGTFTKFPEYMADPEKAKEEADRQRKMAESAKLAAAGGGNAWRPNMSYKSDMTRSIIKMNIR